MESNHKDAQLGLVISYFGNSVAVEALNGQVFQCHLKRNQALPVVGDHVQFQMESDDRGVILAIEPRKSTLARGDMKGQMKPIAANVDLIAIMMAPAPIFSEYLVDRYLIAAELLNIPAILILNKVDLLNREEKALNHARLGIYETIYPVFYGSALTGDGLDEIKQALRDKTAVLVGPSGVGKSSMISALGFGDSIRIGEVSAKGAGKHTTTATRLYHLPFHADLIDSPGVREFALWPVDEADILRGFKEFADFTKDCKFRDCKHFKEPGCKVKEAVESGKISATRFANYEALMLSAKENNKKYQR